MRPANGFAIVVLLGTSMRADERILSDPPGAGLFHGIGRTFSATALVKPRKPCVGRGLLALRFVFPSADQKLAGSAGLTALDQPAGF